MDAKYVSVIAIAVMAIAAILIAVAVTDDGGKAEDPQPEPSVDPMDVKLEDMPIGTVMVWKVTGTYTVNDVVYDISGEEKYTVASKDSKNISFKVYGTTYASHGSQKAILSKMNGDIKTWELSDHFPYEVGELDTPFGIQKVKVTVFDLPDTAGGNKVTDLGSKQYWGFDNGIGFLQKMSYSLDEKGVLVNQTKTLVSIELK